MNQETIIWTEHPIEGGLSTITSDCGKYFMNAYQGKPYYRAYFCAPDRPLVIAPSALKEDAKRACENHKMQQLKDPQVLVDAIKTARPKIIELLKRFGTMDAARDPLTELDAALKQWEGETK